MRPLVGRSRLLAYRDNDTWARAVERQIAAVVKDDVNALVVGADPMALRIAVALAERGNAVAVLGSTAAEAASIVDAARRCAGSHVRIDAASDARAAAATAGIVVAFARESLDEQLVASLPEAAIVFDAGIGALGRGAAAVAAARGVTVIRPDMRAVLAAEIFAALGA